MEGKPLAYGFPSLDYAESDVLRCTLSLIKVNARLHVLQTPSRSYSSRIGGVALCPRWRRCLMAVMRSRAVSRLRSSAHGGQ
jgi:hypothetical protein